MKGSGSQLTYTLMLLGVLVGTLDAGTIETIAVNTSVVYNALSASYDLPLNSAFTVSCVHPAMRCTLFEPSLSWLANKKGRLTITDYLYQHYESTERDQWYKRVDTDTHFTVQPEGFTDKNIEAGIVSITEQRASAMYYDEDNPVMSYRCSINCLNGSFVNFAAKVTSDILYEATIDISVVAPAVILSITENKLLTEGDSLTLKCSTFALPRAEVTWSKAKDGVLPASIGGGLSYKSSDGSLVIDSVTSDVSGTYICTASNRVTTEPVTGTVTVEVKYKPLVTAHALIVNQMVDYHTEMSCQVVADPPVTSVRWYYRPTQSRVLYGEPGYGLDIGNTSVRLHYSQLDNEGRTTLTIEAVTKDDFTRQFCCVFRNDIGYNEQCIKVISAPKPVLVNGQLPRKAESHNHSTRPALSSCCLSTTIGLLTVYMMNYLYMCG